MKKSVIRNFQHQIKILENLSNSDLEEQEWQEKLTLYAEIKPICDNRFETIDGISFGHIMTEGFFIFKIRFIKDIHVKMRIKLKTRYFEIKRIINIDERSRFLNIIALEIYGV